MLLMDGELVVLKKKRISAIVPLEYGSHCHLWDWMRIFMDLSSIDFITINKNKVRLSLVGKQAYLSFSAFPS